MNKLRIDSDRNVYLNGIKLQGVMSCMHEVDNVFEDAMIATIKLKVDNYEYFDEFSEKEEVQSEKINDAIGTICDWIKKELQNAPHEVPTYKPVIIDEKKMKLIAEWYGYEPQSRQCIEEMSELTQAINKLWRKKTFGGNSIEISQAHENVIEEIADVSIMICQMKELLGVKEDDISEIINQKLDRQLERINTLGKQSSEIQEDKIMIKCTNGDCTYGHCCIECDAQKSKGPLCGCNIAEDCVTREEILKICPYAEEAKSKI